MLLHALVLLHLLTSCHDMLQFCQCYCMLYLVLLACYGMIQVSCIYFSSVNAMPCFSSAASAYLLASTIPHVFYRLSLTSSLSPSLSPSFERARACSLSLSLSLSLSQLHPSTCLHRLSLFSLSRSRSRSLSLARSRSLSLLHPSTCSHRLESTEPI